MAMETSLSSNTTAGITERFVMCPRCRGILREQPGISVFRCGGCDAILQAKNGRSVANAGSTTRNTDTAERHELDHPSEDQEPRISSHGATIPPSGESSSDPIDENNQNGSGDCSSEELRHLSLSECQKNAGSNDESHASGEFPLRENGELSDRDLSEAEEVSISSSHEAPIPSSGECVMDPNDEKDQNDSGDSSSEQLVRRKHRTDAEKNEESHPCHGEQPGFPNRVCSKREFVHLEIEELSGRDPLEEEDMIGRLVHIKSSKGQNNTISKEESSDFHGEQPGCSNQGYSTIDFVHHENGKLSEAEEPSTSSREVITIPFSGESILDPKEKDQDENEDNSCKPLVRRHLSERKNAHNDNESHTFNAEKSGFSRPTESESKEASTSSREVLTVPFSSDCILGPNDEKNHKENENCSRDQLLHTSLSKHQSSANNDDESRVFHGEQSGFSHPTEIEEASTSSCEVMAIQFSGKSILDPNEEKDQIENEESRCEQLIHRSLSERQKNASYEFRTCHGEQSEFSNQVLDASGFTNHEKDRLSSENSSEDEIIDEILLSGDKTSKAGDSKEINPSFESSGIINQIAASSSDITGDTQLDARMPSKTLTPLAEQVEESAEIISRDFEHQRSVDNFESLEVNHCCEPSDALLGIIKSPTTKSFLAYYGSVSSFDGMDDQFLDIHRSANFLASRESPRREKPLMNNAVARDSKTPYEARSSRINLSKEKHYAIENHRRNQEEYRRRDFSTQSSNRLERDRYQTNTLLLGRDSLDSFENGSTSGSMFEEFHDSKSHLSANFSDHGQEKARLLKMVYDLQNQLETSLNLNEKASGRIPMRSSEESSWMETYYNHQIPQEVNWHDLENPHYLERSNYPRKHLLSRKISSFSGPQINRFRAEHLPENCPRSMQLLPSQWHNGGSRMAQTSYDSQSYYSSCQSSPRHYQRSQFPARGGHTKAEKLRMRERNHVVKHHLRPMAGGAPFITCYYCLKLLQIPAEFFLLKRRCNRLKCGHCSKTLEFSLQSRTHIVPYMQSAAETQPSEIDKRSAMNQGPFEDHSTSSSRPSRNGQKEIKKFSENEKSLAMESSPLHQLMGYASPSQVINGVETSGRRLQMRS